MRVLTDDLTVEDLVGITQTGELVYSKPEEEFLGKYAPYRFSQRPLVELLNDKNTREHVLTEVNQIVFDIIVKLDISIARNSNLVRLSQEKAEQLNPILRALSIEDIVLGNDHLSALYDIKTKGLEVLKRTTPSDFSTLTRKVDCYDFQSERGELCELFGSNVPIIVYGSSLVRDKPSDIDTMVFPSKFTEETYRRIQGVYNPLREPLLSFVIVPQANIPEFALSDVGNKPHSKNSVLINGELTFPLVGEDYFNYLGVHNAANDYMRLRTALTPQGLDSCEGILPRINGLLKIPKFFYVNLNFTSDSKLPEPEIKQFESLPSRNALVEALVNANMQIYRMLIAYQNR